MTFPCFGIRAEVESSEGDQARERVLENANLEVPVKHSLWKLFFPLPAHFRNFVFRGLEQQASSPWGFCFYDNKFIQVGLEVMRMLIEQHFRTKYAVFPEIRDT